MSSSSHGTVEWLYSPWAMSCRASGFFCPEAFFILALLFWNQILIWASFSPSSALSCWRRLSVRYLFSANSCLSLASWAPEKAVRGRLSSALGFAPGFFTRLERGPVKKEENDIKIEITTNIIKLWINEKLWDNWWLRFQDSNYYLYNWKTQLKSMQILYLHHERSIFKVYMQFFK